MTKSVFTFENETDFQFEEQFYQDFTIRILRAERASENYTMHLFLCSEETMKSLNKRYRGADKTTDVLSFPQTFQDCGSDNKNSKHDLGDIIIDINRVSVQKEQNTLEDELLKVYIHGLLHLLGYDHVRKEDCNIMKNKEDKYFKMIRGLS